MRKLQQLLLLLNSLLLLTILSCQSDSFKPLSSDQLTDILIDMHMIDASYFILNGSDVQVNHDSNTYDTIFIKYGIEKVVFDSTISYYTQRPEELKSIYDRVIDGLQEKKAALDRIQFEESAYENLWIKKADWSFPEDGKQGKVKFNIPVKKLGTYVLRAEVRILKDDGAVNPTIYANFTGSNSKPLPFPKLKVQASEKFKLYEISKKLTDTSYVNLEGVILEHTPQGIDWTKMAEVKNIRVFCIPNEQ